MFLFVSVVPLTKHLRGLKTDVQIISSHLVLWHVHLKRFIYITFALGR